MKESGINYFYEKLNLGTGDFYVFYTFEEGAGTNINSVSGAQPRFSGTLSAISNFWAKNGSGFFDGNTISINNANDLHSTSWTKIFVYEKINADEFVLFDSLNGPTGCKIGITPTNKPYFETFNIEPIVAVGSNNISSKNILSFSYATNSLNIGYYNFNSKNVEYETFNYPFQLNRSDNWKLGGGTGYLDYFIHLNGYQSSQTLTQLISGFYARKTGTVYETETYYTTGITGYQDIFFGESGILGYIVTPGGDAGQGIYTGAFPTYSTTTPITGYLNSGIYSSGVSATQEIVITGEQVDLLEILTGYASSFGMEKIQLFSYTDPQDIIKVSTDRTLFNNIYNNEAILNYSAYRFDSSLFESGKMNLFYNGLAQWKVGWRTSGDYIYVNGSQASDIVSFDYKSGDFKIYPVAFGSGSFYMPYSGQEIYLNGLNLISGYDFSVSGETLIINNRNADISGYIFEYPVVLDKETGNFSIKTLNKFGKDSANLYFNGLRQRNKQDYIEGAFVDLLSGNFYNDFEVQNIYNDNNLYWET